VRDLYVAVVLVVFAGLVALVITLLLGRGISRRAGALVSAGVVGLIVAHVLLVSDRLWVARVLPFSSVPVLGNIVLLALVGTLAGLAWRAIPGHPVRRGLLVIALFAACVYRTLLPAFPTPPTTLADRWRAAVCLQTSSASCSPAAVATLLRAHGIDATEAEMARLCLSSERGTAILGRYRGLKLKTAGTPWDVEVFRTDEAGLRQMTGPTLLSVRLDPAPGVDPRYEQLWGWTPGVAHTVVCFGFTADGQKVEMGDPAVGREHWSTDDLGVLWKGEGLRLVRR
jgi:hypothetical protein